jgi:hypothetical protein
MKKNILENYIRLEIQKINEENKVNFKVKNIEDIKTYGDLRALLANAKLKNKNKQVFKIAKTIAGVLPGVDTVTNVGDILLGMWNFSKKGKKTNSFLDNFRINKEIQQILDNKLEEDFLTYVWKDIQNEKNDEPIESFDMNKKLNSFLKDHFKGVHFVGYDKE